MFLNSVFRKFLTWFTGGALAIDDEIIMQRIEITSKEAELYSIAMAKTFESIQAVLRKTNELCDKNDEFEYFLERIDKRMQQNEDSLHSLHSEFRATFLSMEDRVRQLMEHSVVAQKRIDTFESQNESLKLSLRQYSNSEGERIPKQLQANTVQEQEGEAMLKNDLNQTTSEGLGRQPPREDCSLSTTAIQACSEEFPTLCFDWDTLKKEIGDALKKEMEEMLKKEIGDTLKKEIGDTLKKEMEEMLKKEMEETLRRQGKLKREVEDRMNGEAEESKGLLQAMMADLAAEVTPKLASNITAGLCAELTTRQERIHQDLQALLELVQQKQLDIQFLRQEVTNLPHPPAKEPSPSFQPNTNEAHQHKWDSILLSLNGKVDIPYFQQTLNNLSACIAQEFEDRLAKCVTIEQVERARPYSRQIASLLRGQEKGGQASHGSPARMEQIWEGKERRLKFHSIESELSRRMAKSVKDQKGVIWKGKAGGLKKSIRRVNVSFDRHM